MATVNGKSFFLNYSKFHLKFNISSFICDFCGKAYTSKAFLLSHQKYHKGVKNKKCIKCPSMFTEDKGLRTHLRRVHKFSEEELLAFQIDGKILHKQ